MTPTKLTHQQLLDRQQSSGLDISLPVEVVLDNVRSGNNVGSIFRTADAVGIKKLWLCGITGYPPNPQVTKTSLGSELVVDWAYEKDILSVIESRREAGYEIVSLEQTAESEDYRTFQSDKPICLIVGHEVEGVSEAVVAKSHRAIEVPMRGIKISLNVAVAFGIVAYEFVNKFNDTV